VTGRSGKGAAGSARGQRKTAQRLDRVPFRRKLNALIAAPCVLIVLLLAPTVVGKVHTARGWQQATTYMDVSTNISSLIDQLAVEQEDALAVGRDQLINEQAFHEQTLRTDAAEAKVEADFGGDPPQSLATGLAAVGRLGAVRAEVGQGKIAGQQLLNDYLAAMSGLSKSMSLLTDSSYGGPAALAEGELQLLYYADMSADEYDATLAEIADNPADLRIEITSAQAALAVQQTLVDAFQAIAPAGFDGLLASVQDDSESSVLSSFDVSAEQAADENTVFPGDNQLDTSTSITSQAIQQCEAISAMEEDITSSVITNSQHSASIAAWTAVGLVALGLALLILLIVCSVLIRHSIVRPVLRLTRAATRIATVAEQDLERVADDTVGGEAPLELETVQSATRDEIGDLAESFNRLQGTAVRVLERQVAVRRNTAEMFGNVGRRIHNLTGRQLALIDTMERAETNPVLLERLYRIDHLAVRLQRGADSLVLLSGEREPSLDATPLPLTDVVRSAAGRIEGYQRVVLTAEGDAAVVPSAIGDLTLMVAELVENAVAFSPGSSTVDVTVSVRGRGQGATIEIVDRGVGMPPKRLAEENERLVRRERLDLAPTRVLGLFVVGRLAQRTGAQVVLAPTPGGGLTARIAVPIELLLESSVSEARPTRAPEIPKPVQPPALPQSSTPPALPAAMPEQRSGEPTQGGLPRRAGRQSGKPSAIAGAAAAARAIPQIAPPAPSVPRQSDVSPMETTAPLARIVPDTAPVEGSRPTADAPSNAPVAPIDALSTGAAPISTDVPINGSAPINGVAAANGTAPAGTDQSIADAILKAASARAYAPRSPFVDSPPQESPPGQATSEAAAVTSTATPTAPETPTTAPTEAPATPTTPTEPTAPPGARPALPRRQRGQHAPTDPVADRLRTPADGGPAVRGTTATALAPAAALDPEAARAAIEEFEAAVDQALRDSATDIATRPGAPDRTASTDTATGSDEERGARP
jgi:signal transduction histidine kinase